MWRVARNQLRSPTERSSVDDVRARAATSGGTGARGPPVTVETLVVAGLGRRGPVAVVGKS